MTSSALIACELHDHLELACVFGYELEVRLADDVIRTGRALTTRTAADKTEYLILEADGDRTEVPMHSIASLRVLTPGAGFEYLAFALSGGRRSIGSGE